MSALDSNRIEEQDCKSTFDKNTFDKSTSGKSRTSEDDDDDDDDDAGQDVHDTHILAATSSPVWVYDMSPYSDAMAASGAAPRQYVHDSLSHALEFDDPPNQDGRFIDPGYLSIWQPRLGTSGDYAADELDLGAEMEGDVEPSSTFYADCDGAEHPAQWGDSDDTEVRVDEPAGHEQPGRVLTVDYANDCASLAGGEEERMRRIRRDLAEMQRRHRNHARNQLRAMRDSGV